MRLRQRGGWLDALVWLFWVLVVGMLLAAVLSAAGYDFPYCVDCSTY